MRRRRPLPKSVVKRIAEAATDALSAGAVRSACATSTVYLDVEVEEPQSGTNVIVGRSSGRKKRAKAGRQGGRLRKRHRVDVSRIEDGCSSAAGSGTGVDGQQLDCVRLRWPDASVSCLCDCGEEFVRLLVSEADRISRETKKGKGSINVVNSEHCYQALKFLELDSFIAEAKLAVKAAEGILQQRKDRQRKKTKRKKMSPEELEEIRKEQDRLFQAALPLMNG